MLDGRANVVIWKSKFDIVVRTAFGILEVSPEGWARDAPPDGAPAVTIEQQGNPQQVIAQCQVWSALGIEEFDACCPAISGPEEIYLGFG